MSSAEHPGQGNPDTMDFEALLSPISEDKPSGENLKYTGLFDEIREARRSDDEVGQTQWGEPKRANWTAVLELASEGLAKRSKDLQLAAWLTEASVRQHGFAGLRDGLKLTAGLLERFWDTLYPEADEGDLEGRANSLSWLDRQTGLALRLLPLTQSPLGSNFSLAQYEDSRKFDVPDNLEALEYQERERVLALKARAADEGKATSEQWRSAKGATRRAFYEAVNVAVSECQREFNGLDKVMDEKFGRHTPGLGALKKALADVEELVGRLVKEKRLEEPDPIEESSAASAADGEEARSGLLQSGPIRSRREALQRLSEVAAFFRATEPHSPVSYLVQRAIKWGQMPLDTWLEDVIKDSGVLDRLRETLGLKGGSGE